jgi:hypothetical protein
MRIFLDAGILFSAAKSAGAVRNLLQRLEDAEHTRCIDAYVEFEARRNLESKAADSFCTFDELIERCELAPVPSRIPPASWTSLLPEKDRPVPAAAIRLRCEILVTGDRTHFGTLFGRTIDGVTIHSPRSLAEHLSL